METLREKIADEISDIYDIRARDEIFEAADRILAIPEIAEALESAAFVRIGAKTGWRR